ncbi:class I SAM-dependent methyltransferase [Plantactinospora sp. GCM10030261]|uniref:class I SAM-dependent methyltransferase n=1 Tax=Plantactinospora sp. GCM10030261 TaxID=3273420 RepID=UPI003622CE97
MPTQSARPSPDSHQHRQAAESFGVDPERYDRTRPAYPDALVHRIVAASPGPDILDVGCGTGTAARQFQAAGCTVLGIEPDTRMAEFARRDGLDVEVTTFETWNAAGRTFDAVIAATAWHWVDPVAGTSTAAHVLRPGGLLAPFWHVAQLPSAVAEALATAFEQAVPDAPVNLRSMGTALDTYEKMFDKAADAIRATDGFDEPQLWRHDWEKTYTRDEWLDQVPTSGLFTRLPREALDRILTAVGTAIDALGGELTVPYATVAVAAVRRG